MTAETVTILAAKLKALFPHLDERQRRMLIGAEVCVLDMAGSAWRPELLGGSRKGQGIGGEARTARPGAPP
ncbi:hypothetical protein ACIBG8_29150 [Nonomuraea sp. NPDC050556]|uniref:hypothetical protein n=1 Tax=Nonomuraea sp. NPDC050556 TaxID=3364369 RepID=UPI0037B6CB7A